MNYKCKPFYLEFPIFQIVYIILWIPLGFYVSTLLSAVIVSFVFKIFSLILGAIYSFAFELFIISGRMQAMVKPYYFIAMFFFDLIILIIGLELINHFLNKKRFDGGFDERSVDGQN